MPDQEVENNRDLVNIKNWLCKQPHLPHDVDDLLLRRFLTSCGHSLERAKRTIDLFFTIRSNAPEVFFKRDPWSPEIQRVFQITSYTFEIFNIKDPLMAGDWVYPHRPAALPAAYVKNCHKLWKLASVDTPLQHVLQFTDLIPLPKKTKENYKVFIYRLNNPDLDMFNFVDAVKTFFMLADTRLTEEDDVPAGEIPIFDSANVSLKFISKINLSVLRKYMLYTQEAIPIRLKQVHVINAPAYISKIHAICKPFIKTEVAKLIKFHEPNSDTLYKDIPQDLLPDEYGGKAGTIEQLKRYWIKRIEAKRDWFLTHDERWVVDESLRPGNCQDERADKVRDLPGSFRSLALD